MISVVMVAAGRGTRMGAGEDKLFLDLAGRPVVARTWAVFDALPEVREVVVVVRPGMESVFCECARQWGVQHPYRVVPGGPERQDSVWNGLQAVSPGTEMVAVQDGARPCTSAATIRATVEAAGRTGAAVAARRVTDTLKEEDGVGRILRTVDRSRLWSVQTPQVFRLEVIIGALREARARGVVMTDDTAACEQIGQPVELVECLDPNPKVTVPGDLAYVELLVRQRAERLAVGGEK